MTRTYTMAAEENYDSAHVASIAALTTYHNVRMGTDQNYQGIQWDPVRRNLMYMYTESIPSTPTTNTTGFSLWDGEVVVAPGGAINHRNRFNSSVGIKNIDTGYVSFNLNYNSANTVPNGIGGSDGTYRRYTREFAANFPAQNSNGPGMTDPYTGNFWIHSESCELYCFRLTDSYSQVISPLFPVHGGNNDVNPVGFTNTGATNPWTFAREINQAVTVGAPSTAYLYLTPRLFTAAETAADYILRYATYTYPRTGIAANFYAYNREVFDHSGNMYLFSCIEEGGKSFKLHKFSPPTAANYPTAAIGGGFTDITPWDSSSGPNADATDYTLARIDNDLYSFKLATPDIIPMYLPVTDDLVLIEKFFPREHTLESFDPALMSWSCTYVHAPAGTSTWDHHSAFVTGYMTENWEPTDITGATYSVTDAFEVNNYLGQSDYLYDIDYTKRWFFFACTKMVDGVSDGKPRIVLVEYEFVYGNAPSVSQVIDEQGWDDTYPAYGPFVNWTYPPYDYVEVATVAVSMNTDFNPDFPNTRWDVGIHDPTTNTFWWSGGGYDENTNEAFFCRFDPQFADRMETSGEVPGGTQIGATPPFMRLSFSGEPSDDNGDLTIRCWAFSLDDHDFYVLRLGSSETLIYDLKTEQWSSWESPDRTNWRLHVGQNWVGYTDMGDNNTDVIAGDDVHGVLWVLSADSGLDDRVDDSGLNDPFIRVVTGGIQVVGRKNIPCGAVTVDVALGAPVDTGTRILLEISDDFGHTWVDCGTVTIPAADYEKTIEWRALGLIKAPGRIFRFTDTGASVRISGANMR